MNNPMMLQQKARNEWERYRRGRYGLPVLWIAALVLLAGSAPANNPNNPDFEGQWVLQKQGSTPVDPWSNLSLEIAVDGQQVTIERIWSAGRFRGVDDMTLEVDGGVNREPLHRWLANRHLGAEIREDTTRQVTAEWLDDGRTLRVESRYTVLTSQGRAPIRTYSEYRLSPDGRTLTLLELRSTRPRPMHYIFTRADPESA